MDFPKETWERSCGVWNWRGVQPSIVGKMDYQMSWENHQKSIQKEKQMANLNKLLGDYTYIE